MRNKNINKRTTIIAAIATLVVLALALMLWAIYGRNNATTDKEETAKEVVDTTAICIATLPTLDCLPIFVAHDDSLYSQIWHDFRIKEFSAQMDCDTALIGGSAQIGFTDVVRAQRMIRKRTPLDFLSSTNLGWKLIANSKTRIREIKDFDEKLVAISRFSGSDLLSEKSIEDAGIKKEKVFRVQINDFGIRLRMFINNELDGVLLPEPFSTEATNLKNKVLADYEKLGFHLGAIVTRTDMMKGKDKQLEAFIKMYDMAVDSINKNGVQHYRDVIKKYCKVKSSTIDSLQTPVFTHISPVKASDVELAQKWLDKH